MIYINYLPTPAIFIEFHNFHILSSLYVTGNTTLDFYTISSYAVNIQKYYEQSLSS